MKSSPFIQKYLRNVNNNANERMVNFTGRDNNYANFTANERYFNADAAAPAQAAPAQQAPAPSRPYIITVSNSSNVTTVSNFDILGAYQYLFSSGFNANTGALTISGVTISSGLSNVTYQFLLQQSQQNPFTVGRTLIQSQVNSSQITQTINVTTTDASGLQAVSPLIPIIDPYQNQTNNLVVDMPFRIDGSTKLTFSQILPNSVFTVYLYPSVNINPSRDLTGSDAQRQYAAPGIIRNNVAVIPAGGTLVSRINS